MVREMRRPRAQLSSAWDGQLRVLSLQGVAVGLHGARKLADYVRDSTHLERITINGTINVQSCRTASALNLASAGYGVEEAIILGDALLPFNQKLVKVDLGFNEIGQVYPIGRCPHVGNLLFIFGILMRATLHFATALSR